MLNKREPNRKKMCVFQIFSHKQAQPFPNTTEKKSALARVGNPLFQAQIIPGFLRSSNISIN